MALYPSELQKQYLEQAYTVATLPAAASHTYLSVFVTDASAPTWGATVTGGGAVVCKVFSDGTNWVVG